MAGPFAQVALALMVVGAGIVVEGEPTSLPVSPNAGLSIMEPTRGDEMAFGDAGLAWVPEAPEYPDRDPNSPVDAGAPAAPPDAGAAPALSAACRSIQDRIDHRQKFLLHVADTVVLVGYEQAMETWCQHHPEEGECRRPPAVEERDISEVVVPGTDGAQPEADAWIIRWERELAQCVAATPRPPRQSGPVRR